MEKKHLIGKKVKITGFWWGSEGKTGEVYNVREIGSVDLVDIKFYDGGTIEGVPINLIKQTQPSQYEVGMTVYDAAFGEGRVGAIGGSTNYPISVDFERNSKFYTSDGRQYELSPRPTLSLTPYDPINGGATFPTFKPKVLEIERGKLVFVKDSAISATWHMRFFSHFDGSGNINCFKRQYVEGDTKPWPEYSLTNPLIEEK